MTVVKLRAALTEIKKRRQGLSQAAGDSPWLPPNRVSLTERLAGRRHSRLLSTLCRMGLQLVDENPAVF